MFDNPLKIVSFGKSKPDYSHKMKSISHLIIFLIALVFCKYKEQSPTKTAVQKPQKTTKASPKAKAITKIDIKKATKNLTLSEAIDRHIQIMDSAYKEIDMDLITEVNTSLKETLIERKNDIYNAKTKYVYNFNVIKSADKKLCLVSWNTLEGGAGSRFDYANLAFFKGATTMQVDTTLGHRVAVMYDTIYTIPHQKSIVYIVQSLGGVGVFAWRKLEAFKIVGNQLTHPSIFPDTEPDYFGEYESGYHSGIGVEFSREHLDENREWPTFKITNQGKTVWVPLHTADEGFAGKYQVLQWNGKAYQRK